MNRKNLVRTANWLMCQTMYTYHVDDPWDIPRFLDTRDYFIKITKN